MTTEFQRRLSLPLLAFSILFATSGLRADTRETTVPNNFANAYVGFTSVSNTNVTITGNDASWIGQSGGNFSVTLNDMEQKNNIWGGFAAGHWFKQAPISFGLSGAFDIFPAILKEQTKTNVPFVIDGKPGTFTSFTKFQTNVLQMVPAMNLIAGIPLKFVRVYAGVGPGLFLSLYSFTVKSGGRDVGTVSAVDAHIGFNAFLGVDVFISRHLSVFLEGKYSQVNNLKFQPNQNDPLIAGRTVEDDYDSIKTQRVGVGLSYHF